VQLLVFHIRFDFTNVSERHYIILVRQYESEATNHLHGILLLCGIIAPHSEGPEFVSLPEGWLPWFNFVFGILKSPEEVRFVLYNTLHNLQNPPNITEY
jgi:hypothetical protein